jgi:hypothetical protein
MEFNPPLAGEKVGEAVPKSAREHDLTALAEKKLKGKPPGTDMTEDDLLALDGPTIAMPADDAYVDTGKGYRVPQFMVDAQDNAKRRALIAAQDTERPSPDAAAKARPQAQARGLPLTAVIDDPGALPPKDIPVTWDNYADNEPLSKALLDPNYAPLIADEADKIAQTAGFDKDPPVKGRFAMQLEAGRLGVEEAHLWTKKGMQGGVLSPEDDARLKQVQAAKGAYPPPSGLLDEAVGMLPMVGGNIVAGAGGAAVGAAMGAPVPGLAAVGGALGARVGSLAFNADQMIGMDYQQYTEMGMPHNVAWPAALIAGSITGGIETVTFGLLAKVPALKMLGKVPGVDLLNKTNIGPAMAAALKDSKFVQILAGLGKDVAHGAAGNSLMDAVTILGAYAANAAGGGGYNVPTASEAVARVLHAAELGGVVGVGLGGSATLFHETLGKIHVAEGSQPMVDRLYDLTENLKSSERAPDVVAKIVNENAKTSSVKHLTVPLEDLTKLLDQNAEAPQVKEWLAKPENRAKLDEAAKLGTRVELPVGDFVAYIRPFDKARVLNQLIGVNDEMSTAEAKELKPRIEKARKEIADLEKRKRDIENAPESQIQEAVQKQLKALGYTTRAADFQGQLIAAGVSNLARRAGKDPWEVYKGAALTITREGLQPRGKKGPTEALAERYLGLTPHARASEYYVDANTGMLNERGFRDAPADPAKPLTGYIEFEGSKWVNDKGQGHHQTDLLYRAVGKAIHDEDQGAAKVGGGFAVKVASQADLDAIVAKASTRAPEGFTIVGRTGDSLETAKAALVTEKQRAEEAGTRAKRGEKPLGVKETDAKKLAFNETKAQGSLTDALVAKHGELSPEQAFGAYVEPHTGLRTSEGWAALPRKKFQASLDLGGIGWKNANLGTLDGDAAIRVAGQIMKAIGADEFDGAHVHGDEYLFQSNDKAKLGEYLKKLNAELAKAEVEVYDSEKKEVRVAKGIGIGFGVGTDADSMEKALNEHKTQLTKEGKRGDDVEAKRIWRREATPDDVAAHQAAREGNLPAGDAARGDGQGDRGRAGEPGRGEAAVPGFGVAAQDARGNIAFNESRDAFHVTLTGKANKSTFLHEASHYLLEVMRKLDQETGAFRDDLAELEKWAGVEAGGEWTDAALEKFARGMETYFGEGKAPSAKLASAFADFKQWILHVYKTLVKLGAPLTDEVRGVMDRMLASDDEIATRRQELGYFPNELIIKHGDMDEEQQKQYRAVYEKGAQQAQTKIEREAIAALHKEASTDYKHVQAEVDRSLDQLPVLSLRLWLEGKDRTDGGPVPEVVGKLDAEAVKEMRLDSGVLAKVKDSLTDRNGADPEIVAPYFGFKNGAEMVTELARTPARETLKRALVKSEFQKLHPEYGPDPVWLEKTALEELHGADAIANAMEIELRVLYKKANMLPPNSPALVAREAARANVGEMLTSNMKAAKYREAESRFLREQQKALVAKDFQAAAEAARKRIYNRAMWQEVQRAADKLETAHGYLERFTSEEAQGRIGRSSMMKLPGSDERVGQVLRDATKALLEGTGFAEETYASRDTTFDGHLNKLESAGLPVSVDPVLRERPLDVWENLTYTEAMAAKDAMKNLSAISRMQNEVRIGEQAYHLDDVGDQIRANMEASGLLDRLGEKGEKTSVVRRLRAETTKPETIALDIDGGEPGIFHKLFVETMAQGEYEKDRRFRQRRDDLRAMGEEFRPKDWAKQMKAKYTFDDGREYTGAEVFAMLLNFGTAQNRSKLITGMEKAGREGWNEQSVLSFIHKVFPDRAAYDYAQAIWKYLSRPDLWDDASKIREAISGVRPEKVPSLSVPTPDGGSVEGGYYHLLYDRKVPLKEAETSNTNALAAMNDANPLNLYAANGFLKGRTGYSAPLLLDPTAWSAHLYEVDHFISNAQGIIDRHKLIDNPKVKEAIVHGLGFEYWEQLRQSNNYVAADGEVLTREVLQMSRGIDKLIYHNALLTMGGNVLSGINQVVTGVPATLTKLGPKGLPVFGKVLADFVRHPFDMWKDVATKSGEVQGMDFHIDRDLRIVIAREMLGETGTAVDYLNPTSPAWNHLRSRIASTSMNPIVFGQKLVNVLTFETGRRIAESEGKSATEQVAYGNSIVRQTQSASAPMDHTGIQRSGDGLMRILTSLASYTFSLNDMVMPRRLTQREIVGGVSRLVMLTLTTAMAKSLLDAVLPKLEEKDAERRKGVLKMAEDADMPGLIPLTEGLTNVLGSVPVVGRPAESLLTGHEPRFASWVNTGMTMAKAGYHVSQGQELGKAEMKAIVESLGLVYGIPTRHLMFGPGEAVYEVMNGNVSGGPWGVFQEATLVKPGQKGDHSKGGGR